MKFNEYISNYSHSCLPFSFLICDFPSATMNDLMIPPLSSKIMTFFLPVTTLPNTQY